MTVKTSGKKLTVFPDTAYLERDNSSVKLHTGRSGLLTMEARRLAIQMTALTAKPSLQRDVMGMRRLLRHAHEGMVRDTAQVASTALTVEWRLCVGCSKVKARRFAVPKTKNGRMDEPLGQVLCDLAGAMERSSVGGKHFMMIFVNDYSRMKWTAFLQKKS